MMTSENMQNHIMQPGSVLLALSAYACSQPIPVAPFGRTQMGRVTHGLTHSTTYDAWAQMKSRCSNPNTHCFAMYGGRGISVCDRWRDSCEAFMSDMGERPSPLHSLDRVDTDGNYEPGNCRWATNEMQARNRRNNVLLTHDGETMCISAWAERIGIHRKTLEKRLNHHGFTVE